MKNAEGYIYSTAGLVLKNISRERTKSSDMIRDALKAAGKSQKDLARYMGWSPQNLSGRLKKNTLTFDETIKALKFAGYRLQILDTEGKGIPKFGNSEGPKLVQMIDGVTYDTGKAESICSSREGTSDDFYMELFKDPSGGYFIAHFQLWDGGYNHISPISEKGAVKFCRRYKGLPER